MSRNVIDAEQLIAEVKKYPGLYDVKYRHTDANVRKSHWEEISKVFFGGIWESSSVLERDAFVKEIQAKWKNVRDAYNRMKKLEKEDQLKGTKSRKRYIYADLLTFLDPCLPNFHLQSQSPNAIFMQGPQEDESMESNFENTPIKIDHDMLESNEPTISEPVAEMPSGGGEDSLNSILQELVRLQVDDKNDRMGNKKFLLSLLPFLEKLPDDVNLEVRLQLMSILQTYASGESFLRT